MMPKIVLATVIVLATAAPALAQSPYVSASVGLDVSRFSGVDVPGAQLQPGGEAIALSLRGGTRVGERWGLEVGFTRPSELESESTFGFPIPLTDGPAIRFAGGVVTPTTQAALIFQPSIRSERRDSTVEAAAWVSQTLGSVEFAYLGGVAFNRTVEEITYEWPRRLALLPAPESIRSTTYGVAPLLGIDARFGLTEHLHVVGGTRFQSIGGGTSGTSGWLVRPSVGVMWRF